MPTEIYERKPFRKSWSKYKIKIDRNPYYLSYLLGVVGVGDGYISCNPQKNTYLIGLYVKDKDFLINFKKLLEKRYNIWINHKIKMNKRGLYSFNVVCKEIIYDILKYGKLKDFKECSERIPTIIKESKNKKIIGNYLRGLFDSQGSVNIKWKEIVVVKKNHRVIEDTKELLSYLGINASLYITKKQIEVIKIRDYRSIKRFYKYINFSILRKKVRVRIILNNFKLYFNKINKNELYNLYILKEKSMSEIAYNFNVGIHKIFNFMNKYNLPRRNSSQAQSIRWKR